MWCRFLIAVRCSDNEATVAYLDFRAGWKSTMRNIPAKPSLLVTGAFSWVHLSHGKILDILRLFCFPGLSMSMARRKMATWSTNWLSERPEKDALKSSNLARTQNLHESTVWKLRPNIGDVVHTLHVFTYCCPLATLLTLIKRKHQGYTPMLAMLALCTLFIWPCLSQDLDIKLARDGGWTDLSHPLPSLATSHHHFNTFRN